VATSPPAPRRRSAYAALLSDRHGNLRTTVILACIAGAVIVLAVGSFAALLAAGTGSPETLAIWVVAALVVIKVPLLGGVWWVLSRRRDPVGGGGWTSEECTEILEYLEARARDALGRPDAAARLAYFSREAWHVADAATDADTPSAVATAIRIDAMAAQLEGATRPGPAAPG
jgi:hypothetical protein